MMSAPSASHTARNSSFLAAAVTPMGLRQRILAPSMRINSAMRLLISTDVHEDGASSPRDFKYWVDSALVIDETLLWSDDIRELDLRGRLSGRAISLRKGYGHNILINPLSGIHVIRSIMLIMIRRVIVHQLLD